MSTAITQDILLLSVAQMADLLGTSPRTIWRFLAQGKLPKPLRLGARPRWLVDEVRRWIEAGMPDAKDWTDSR